MLPFELTKDTHTSPFRASYGVSFMSTSTEIDRVIKGFYCICISSDILWWPNTAPWYLQPIYYGISNGDTEVLQQAIHIP